MYADRYAKQKKLDPASLGLSALLVGGIMTGMILSAPDFVKKIPTTIKLIDIKEPTPPPPEPAKPIPKTEIAKTKPVETPLTPPPYISIPTTPDAPYFPPAPPNPPAPFDGTVGGGTIIDPVKPPVIVGPGINARFNYQPDYPTDERRLGREGRVVVRVLVGTDGRVKQVEKISAASDSFFEATRRRALEKWRLTPGTRDGVPVEAWRTMAVSFVMNDE